MRQYFCKLQAKRFELHALCSPPDQLASSPPC